VPADDDDIIDLVAEFDGVLTVIEFKTAKSSYPAALRISTGGTRNGAGRVLCTHEDQVTARRVVHQPTVTAPTSLPISQRCAMSLPKSPPAISTNGPAAGVATATFCPCASAISVRLSRRSRACRRNPDSNEPVRCPTGGLFFHRDGHFAIVGTPYIKPGNLLFFIV